MYQKNEVMQAPQTMPLADMQVGHAGLMIQNAQQMWDMAGVIARSQFKPKGLNTQEDIFLGIQYGFDVGLTSPLQIVQNIAVVNGRPSFYGDMLLGICKASDVFEDHYEEVKQEKDHEGKDDLVCYCYAHRKGESKPHVGRFSFREAQRAGLTGKDTYKGYPKDMLMWKARARAFRAAFPDVLKGVSFKEDLDEPRTRTTVDADVTDAPKKGLSGIVAQAKASSEGNPTREAPQNGPSDAFFDEPYADDPVPENVPPEPAYEPEFDEEPLEISATEVEVVQGDNQPALAEAFQDLARKKGFRVPAMLALLKEHGYTGKIGEAPVEVLAAAIEQLEVSK